MLKNPKNWWKLMKIDNIDREIVHIFWTTWRNSLKFLGKMCLKIILKVTKNHGFTLSLADTFSEKPQGGVKLMLSIWVPINGLKYSFRKPKSIRIIKTFTIYSIQMEKVAAPVTSGNIRQLNNNTNDYNLVGLILTLKKKYCRIRSFV